MKKSEKSEKSWCCVVLRSYVGTYAAEGEKQIE